jgi:pyruvate/2-oxoglutarate dehydrogenase complex dihydrolipoamide dehydrogenase (E3) component
VVIGGTAGLVSAAGTAGLGKVAPQRQLLGGDCLNYGCVPSKALIRAFGLRSAASDFGVMVNGDGWASGGVSLRTSASISD